MFYDISSFPNVLGAIDGTLIPIQWMSGDDEPNYVCRKQYHAINVQAICDAELTYLKMDTTRTQRISLRKIKS